ncbi:glycoside hydrolase family 13 protein [Bacillus sp. KH172YL63]|uniref:glycoside hydrolase family 13 protein n=1 Tax=Bacillus sp. KH172YL63 TaxID=2709784 RepID=UPI0013E4BD64|nr:alpha-glucosidase [Bacillus sp. KH172YL63]BCB02843.1 oligo-1,6-glucosidase [Bacillus sp. KH172YL63]
MTKQWWKESVVYQIYPRSFMDSNGDGIGDIRGIIGKLDYLKLLGVDVIWLSPVYESPNDDNGYDISDYKKIMDEFGTMADWEEMLDEMHKRGMKLVMDLVVNHSSDEHAWFVEAKKSKDSLYRDYYIWREGKDGAEPNNWESVFSGSAWEYDEGTEEYFLHLFSKKQPDLNWENPSLRSEIYSMMKFWLDKGIDGFRMDVINFISKVPGLPDAPNPDGKRYASGHEYFMNGPRIHEFLQEMHTEVLSHYDAMTVGEMPGVTPDEAVLYTGEDRNEVNMVFQFEHMDVDAGPGGKWDVIPFDLVKLKTILTKWQTELHGKGWNSLYWNNHDQPRIVSRLGDDGKYRKKSAKMLATLLHFMQGTPYIYQGEELGMTNVRFPSIDDYKDIETLNMYREKTAAGISPEEILPSIYAKGRDNARTPMQWSDEKNGGFTEGKPWIASNPNYKDINAEEALNDPHSIFYHYQKLIALRKELAIIPYGSFELHEHDHPSVYAYTRTYGNDQLLVLCNVSGETVTIDEIASFDIDGAEVLITNEDGQKESPYTLNPWEGTAYYIRG